MRRTLATSWLLSGLIALTGSAYAQTDPGTTTGTTTGTTATSGDTTGTTTTGAAGETKKDKKHKKSDMDATGTMTTTSQTGTSTGTSTTGTGTSTAAGEEGTSTSHTSSMGGTHTVTREEVHTWTQTIDGREYEVHPNTNSYEGTTGLFHNPTAYTIPKGKFGAQIFRDNLDRDPGDLDISIHGLSWSFGISNHFEIGGNIGIQNRVDADALDQLAFVSGTAFGRQGFYNDNPFVTTPWETGFGDIKLRAKFKLADDYHGGPLAFAISPWIKIGTADELKGLGTGKTSYGADLLLSKSLGYKADIHFLLGGQKNSNPDIFQGADLDLANEFKFGVGLNVPACSKVQLQAEILHHHYTGDDVFPQTNPTDFVVGPVIWFKPGFYIRPALSGNLNFDGRGTAGDSGGTRLGRQLSIGFHPGTACHEIVIPPPPPPPPAANQNPTAACEIERSTVMPGETVRVRATASDPDGDSLTYTWTASAGRITGTGPEATLDTTGVTPPATITVTVRVSDGRGGTAESNCSVRMGEVARKVETTTCTSGGFPRNMARLNNVDKACLDDVASRLKTDPRSRVVIIGYADTSEKTPDVIARKRGEAVKAYLVQNGVDASRIVVRSGAATKPVDTGTSASARSANRRVDVIVPEGATMPEQD
jgi:outer membrane protein OmpA-like peptidoglycan-associated protein